MAHKQVDRRNAKGLVLLTVLLFILVTSLAASSLVTVYVTQAKREKEEQLLFVGSQFQRAIASYYNMTGPGGARSLPVTLDDLLADQRFTSPVHHLRRIDPDPFTGRADWRLVMDNGRIVGVSSQSRESTLKKRGFPKGYESLEDKDVYADWVFMMRDVQSR